MSKIFTKLKLGDAVASGGIRTLRKLSRENQEPVADELAGIWYIKSFGTLSTRTYFYFDGSAEESTFTTIIDENETVGTKNIHCIIIYPSNGDYLFYITDGFTYPQSNAAFRLNNTSNIEGLALYRPVEGEAVSKLYSNTDSQKDLRTIKIGMTSQEFIDRNGEDKYNTFMRWMKDHAAKQ